MNNYFNNALQIPNSKQIEQDMDLQEVVQRCVNSLFLRVLNLALVSFQLCQLAGQESSWS